MIHNQPQILLFDAGGPVLILLFGAIIAGIGFAIIWVSEAIVLSAMKWASVKRTILDVLLVNLVSGVCGLPLTLIFGNVLTRLFQSGSRLPFVGMWIATWAISVAIEGGIMLLFKRHPPRRTWRIALTANTVSYLLIAFLIIGMTR